jgi:hypothetical protein
MRRPPAELFTDRDQANHFIVMGTYYGYPVCCIKSFVTNGSWATRCQFPRAPWNGTGFIPCLDCARHKARNFNRFVNEVILKNRISATPFPDDDFESPLKNQFYDFYVSFVRQTGEAHPDRVRAAWKCTRLKLLHVWANPESVPAPESMFQYGLEVEAFIEETLKFRQDRIWT